MTEKRKYETPTMQIVQLQHQCIIYTSIEQRGRLNKSDDYEQDTDPFDF